MKRIIKLALLALLSCILIPISNSTSVSAQTQGIKTVLASKSTLPRGSDKSSKITNLFFKRAPDLLKEFQDEDNTYNDIGDSKQGMLILENPKTKRYVFNVSYHDPGYNYHKDIPAYLIQVHHHTKDDGKTLTTYALPLDSEKGGSYGILSDSLSEKIDNATSRAFIYKQKRFISLINDRIGSKDNTSDSDSFVDGKYVTLTPHEADISAENSSNDAERYVTNGSNLYYVADDVNSIDKWDVVYVYSIGPIDTATAFFAVRANDSGYNRVPPAVFSDPSILIPYSEGNSD